ncbi:MAG: hypothetical protein ACR2LY_03010 [Thermoleophilaceae bacterium]
MAPRPTLHRTGEVSTRRHTDLISDFPARDVAGGAGRDRPTRPTRPVAAHRIGEDEDDVRLLAEALELNDTEEVLASGLLASTP